MALTYFARSDASDLTGPSGTGGNTRDLVADLTAGGSSSDLATGNMNNGVFCNQNLFTAAGEPGVRGTSGGTFTVAVRVTTQNANIGIRVFLARVNAAGTVQGSEVEASQGSQTAGAASRTYTWSSPGLGTWATGNRLRCRVQLTNTSSSMNQSCAIGVDTSADTVDTPFAAPPPPSRSGTAAWTEASDGIAAAGTVASPWAEGTAFDGITATVYDDTTVTAGQWYRYRVAVADDGTPVSGYTAWVQAQAQAGSDDRTATAAWSEADDSAAASGAHVPPGFAGDAAWSEQSDTAAAAGTVTGPQTGSDIAWTEQPDGIVATAAHVPPTASAGAAWVEAPDETAAAGSHAPPAYTGTVAWSEHDDTVVAAGTYTVPLYTGAAAWNEEADGIVAAGSNVRPEGAAAITWVEAPDGIDATGTHVPPIYTADVAWGEQSDTTTAAGTYLPPGRTGTGAWPEADDTAAASGSHTVPAGAAIDSPHVAGAELTYHVDAEQMVYTVPAELLVYTVPPEQMTVEVAP